MRARTTITVISAAYFLIGCAQNTSNLIKIGESPKPEIAQLDSVLINQRLVKLAPEPLRIIPVTDKKPWDEYLMKYLPNEHLILDNLFKDKKGLTDSTAIDSLDKLIDNQYKRIFTVNELLDGKGQILLNWGEELGYDFESFITDRRLILDDELYLTFKNPKEPRKTYTEEQNNKYLVWYQGAINLGQKMKDIGNFIRTYYNELNSLEKETGFPLEHNAATMLMETNGGKYLGEYNGVSVFASLKIYGYKEKFADKNMPLWLEWCEREDEDPFIPTSRAGAAGLFQFMPKNLLRFAKGIDIFNMKDALGAMNELNIANWKWNKSHYKTSFLYNRSVAYAKSNVKLIKRGAKEKIIIRNELGF